MAFYVVDFGQSKDEEEFSRRAEFLANPRVYRSRGRDRRIMMGSLDRRRIGLGVWGMYWVSLNQGLSKQ